MTLFAVLGRIPELSILELTCILPSASLIAAGETVALLNAPDSTNLSDLMRQLGGTIKLGVVISEESEQNPEIFGGICSELIAARVMGTGKITFGVSAYTVSRKGAQGYGGRSLKTLGKAAKEHLAETGRPVRFVPLKDNERSLSSASVAHNKLLQENGVELVLLVGDGHTLIGITGAVQAFEEYSKRDWDRPQKDMGVGMLPPKLAQMMINLAHISHNKHLKIVDPFCGFGTILQEALLLGYSNAWGSDLSQEMAAASKKNLAWFAQQKNLHINYSHIAACDARNLSRLHKPNTIDAIVTEPYLGPVRTKKSTLQNLAPIISSLSALYSGFLKEAHPLLKNTGTLVMVWPVWISQTEKTFLPLYEKLASLGYQAENLRREVAPNKNITDRGTILIAREGQHVGRELIVLQKK